MTVAGGTPSFDETLFNMGTVLQASRWIQVFANYAQGFGMPDVGRVLRGIEANAGWRISAAHRLEASYAHIEGLPTATATARSMPT